MARVRVWAPGARTLGLETGGRLLEMSHDGAGWWQADEPSVGHGTDYALRIDGDGPFPDPRSAWQPEGVHGPSRWVDHGRFPWSDAGWQQPPLAAGVIYELHVGTFTPGGTFDSAIERLEHLVALGVTHVELMPVAEFSGNRGWGYDGVDLFAPHHAYGGPEGLKRLVDACHRRGLAVLIDVVYNHLGPDGNYLPRSGPYFTRRYATPWGEAVNLDGAGCDEVRRFLVDNALGWLRDYHADGLRIDAIHAFVDTSAVHFLEQLAVEVQDLEAAVGRRLLLIAESDLNDPRVVRPREVGGYGIDAQWNEDFHHALHAALTGERTGYYADFGSIADIAAVMTRGFRYDGCYSVYRGRRHGRPATGIPGARFVGYLQNHDQVGNRAAGDRIGHRIPLGLLKVGSALVLTAPFVPLVFQGEEWAASSPFCYFTDYRDPQLAEAVRRGRREEFAAFGWDSAPVPDPQAQETFTRSRLRWEETSRTPHREVLHWYRSLIRLRRSSPGLAAGRPEETQVRFDEARKWLAIRRGSVIVACNLSAGPESVPLAGPRGVRPLLASDDGIVVEGGRIAMPAQSVVILEER